MMHIKKLSTGYLRAQGDGPCEWAQWPDGGFDPKTSFFPEASESFRKTLTEYIAIRDEVNKRGS